MRLVAQSPRLNRCLWRGGFFKQISLTSKSDGLVKSPKMANFQILRLMISIGYEIEI